MKTPFTKSITFFSVLITGLLLATSCKKDLSAEDVPIPPVVKDHNLVLRFKAVVDTSELEFGKTYTNFFNQTYTVKTFKYYIHGVEMINTDSNRVYRINLDQYFLVDFSDTNTTILKLTVFPFKYNRISFVVGVDSARNVSGAQTGALDPAKGMFWTWNTGYVMAKLEGTAAAAPSGNFEYHIGGFQEPDNVLKKPLLLFPFGETLDLKPEKSSEITVTSNVNSWFFNPHDIKFDKTSIVTTPGSLARQVADNYSKMFTVISVINE